MKKLNPILDEWEEKMKIKVNCLYGQGIAHLYECNTILVDPSEVDNELYNNYTFVSSFMIVLPLLEGLSQ